MLTITSSELINVTQECNDILVKRALEALNKLVAGKTTNSVFYGLASILLVRKAIFCYKTGEFQPEEFYNVIGPDEISSLFHLIK